MSLDVSAAIEAEIVARARAAGVSVGSYLAHLVRENQEVEAMLHDLESGLEVCSPESVVAKIDRSLQQLERGEVVDGEQFLSFSRASMT